MGNVIKNKSLQTYRYTKHESLRLYYVKRISIALCGFYPRRLFGTDTLRNRGFGPILIRSPVVPNELCAPTLSVGAVISATNVDLCLTSSIIGIVCGDQLVSTFIIIHLRVRQVGPRSQ